MREEIGLDQTEAYVDTLCSLGRAWKGVGNEGEARKWTELWRHAKDQISAQRPVLSSSYSPSAKNDESMVPPMAGLIFVGGILVLFVILFLYWRSTRARALEKSQKKDRKKKQ